MDAHAVRMSAVYGVRMRDLIESSVAVRVEQAIDTFRGRREKGRGESAGDATSQVH